MKESEGENEREREKERGGEGGGCTAEEKARERHTVNAVDKISMSVSC